MRTLFHHTIDLVNLATLKELAEPHNLAVEHREPRDGLADGRALLIDADFWWFSPDERERGIRALLRLEPAPILAVHGRQLSDEQKDQLRDAGVHVRDQIDGELIALLAEELAGARPALPLQSSNESRRPLNPGGPRPSGSASARPGPEPVFFLPPCFSFRSEPLKAEGGDDPALPAAGPLDAFRDAGARLATSRGAELLDPCAALLPCQALHVGQPKQVPDHVHRGEVRRHRPDWPHDDPPAEGAIIPGQQVAVRVERRRQAGDRGGAVDLHRQGVLVEACGRLDGQGVGAEVLGVHGDGQGGGEGPGLPAQAGEVQGRTIHTGGNPFLCEPGGLPDERVASRARFLLFAAAARSSGGRDRFMRPPRRPLHPGEERRRSGRSGSSSTLTGPGPVPAGPRAGWPAPGCDEVLRRS